MWFSEVCFVVQCFWSCSHGQVLLVHVAQVHWDELFVIAFGEVCAELCCVCVKAGSTWGGLWRMTVHLRGLKKHGRAI